jgi:REP-associated tyrosine transposase
MNRANQTKSSSPGPYRRTTLRRDARPVGFAPDSGRITGVAAQREVPIATFCCGVGKAAKRRAHQTVRKAQTSRYRRLKIEGGTCFFTLALADRGSDLLVRRIARLRRAYADLQKRLPFQTVAICILPDHIHALWQLPDGDADYACRWSLFKSAFSRGLAPAPARLASKIIKREKGIWQRRYWQHAIRNDADFERHVDYTHYNPVKHGPVARVADWPFSSFHRYVAQGILPADRAGDAKELLGSFGE